MHWQPTLGYFDEGQDLTDPALYTSALAPFGEATRLPRFAYRSRMFALLEDEQLWSRCWIPVGAPLRIPNRGDLLPFTVGNHGTHLRREDDGRVRAYFNFAQHGGCRFVPRQCQTGNKTTCFYTSCGFSRDKGVIRAPEDGTESPEMYMYVGNNPAKRIPVPVVEVGPLAFVSLQGIEDDMSAQLRDLCGSLARHFSSDVTHLAHLEVDGRFNWKMFLRASASVGTGACDIEHYRAGFPNLSVGAFGDVLYIAHVQPVGLERSVLHGDVFRLISPQDAGRRVDESEATDAFRCHLLAIARASEALQDQLMDEERSMRREDDIDQWHFHRWYLGKLLQRHDYVDRPIFGRPGLGSNAGVNSGPF